ncbi:SusE domain-containing protein [Mucilaginibacter sp. X4EP1]|uniref:SusE domain-containing protein n=1 Tax=Mucilaginibacter sp. X4EP1 TaxID=2723092 RepID=UPI002169D3CC|nr:SusE domain-containing protein [Mucilaginibacter sp. X4EP1]MCS3813134.1 hypothetical protein [Mucilaginibacter sp. X4EP1]
MKKILTKYLALGGISMLILSACKKDGNLVTSNGGKAGTLTASTTTLVLDKTKLNDTTGVINFNFTASNYGYKAAVTNTLQIDLPGDNWKNPTSVTLGTKVYSQNYSTAAFNALLLKLGIPAGTVTPIQARIQHSISASVAPIYSNVVDLNVTAFNLTSWLYVVGAFQGWNASAPDSLVSITGNGVYVGIINFTPGNNQFLVLPQKGSYNNKYATNDPTGSTSSTVTQNANNNFYAPSAAGQYLITLNLNTNTISIVAADYYSVIGDAALGWSTDVPMKYVNDGNQNWMVTLSLSASGSFKVRQDDAWGNSWGIPKSGSAGFGTAGVLNDSSNNNISIATNGTYTVTFTQTPSAFGGSPTVTATYTVTQ